MKKGKSKKIAIRNKFKLSSSTLLLFSAIIVFIGGFLYLSLIKGSGPFSFLAANPSINEVATPACYRRTDGQKVCTKIDVSTNTGVKTVKTTTQIISNSATGTKTGGAPVYQYDVTATTPVDSAGKSTGNTTTVETRSNVHADGTKEVLSTVTTVQKPAPLDASRNPTGIGEVVGEVRTGDTTLGMNPSTNNTVTQSTEVNCDKGVCNTQGSPICYGSYAFTGAAKDTTGRECKLCGSDGKGGTKYTGSYDCGKLIKQGAPVVMAPNVDPKSVGLAAGTLIGACFSSRGSYWIQAAVGQPGEGPNQGKVCGVSGNWVLPSTKFPTVNDNAGNNSPIKMDAVTCHAQHPGYIFGTDFDGNDVCLPNTTVNQTMLSVASPCKPGKGKLNGKDVYITCKLNGAVESYTFCSTAKGFDANGKCQADSSSLTFIDSIPANNNSTPTKQSTTKLNINDPCGEGFYYVGNECASSCPGGKYSKIIANDVTVTKCGTPDNLNNPLATEAISPNPATTQNAINGSVRTGVVVCAVAGVVTLATLGFGAPALAACAGGLVLGGVVGGALSANPATPTGAYDKPPFNIGDTSTWDRDNNPSGKHYNGVMCFNDPSSCASNYCTNSYCSNQPAQAPNRK